jgi:hypothetical protein
MHVRPNVAVGVSSRRLWHLRVFACFCAFWLKIAMFWAVLRNKLPLFVHFALFY